MNSIFRTVMLWLALLVVIMTSWHFAQTQRPADDRIGFSELLARLDAGEARGLVIDPISGGNTAEFWLWTGDGEPFRAIGLLTDGVLERIQKAGVPFEVRTANNQQTSWSNILISFVPFILLIGFWIFFMKKMGGGINLNTAKKAVATRLDREAAPAGTLVGAAASALPELRGLVTAPRPASVLIVGPSGCGKTHLVGALAANLKHPCLWSEGSSFIGMFMGMGAARIQDLMARAKKEKAVFAAIDGLDDLCRLRIAESRAERDERHQAMQALIAAIDQWRAKPTFALIGVTNRPDLIDEAIIRRFDRVLTLGAPQCRGARNPSARAATGRGRARHRERRHADRGLDAVGPRGDGARRRATSERPRDICRRCRCGARRASRGARTGHAGGEPDRELRP